MSKTGSTSNRFHQAYKPSVIDNSSYLKKIIVKVKDDDTKVECMACRALFKKSIIIYFENLYTHLKSTNHTKTAKTKEQKEDLCDAVAYLSPKNKSALTAPSSESNKDSDQVITQTPSEDVRKKVVVLKKPSKADDTSQQMMPEVETTNKLSDDDNLFKNNQTYYRFQVSHFIMSNNLPFSLADKMARFQKELLLYHEPSVLANYTVDRNVVSSIASTVIGPYLQENYLSILENRPFSIALDESCAKGKIEYLAINARYIENEGDTMSKTRLLAFIELQDSYTGETIHRILQDLLFSGPRGVLRRQNLMGISADGASSMISECDAGVTNRFQNELPYIEVVHDLCHAIDLVLEDCIKKFPPPYKEDIEKISTAFSRSPQRAVKLKYTIKSMPDRDDKIYAIKRYVPVRWSSFKDCLERIVELIEPLKKFFEKEKIKGLIQYFDAQGQKETMLRLYLCLVSEIDIYIKSFQEEDRDVTKIVKDIKHCIVTFGLYIFNVNTELDKKGFIKYDKLYTIIVQLSVDDEEKVKSTEQFKEHFLSKYPEFASGLNEKSEEYKTQFFRAAFDFYKLGFTQLKQRLPLSSKNCLMLADSFLLKESSALENLKTLAKRFKNIIPEDEYNSFCKEVKNAERDAQDIIDRLKESKKTSWLNVWRDLNREYPLIYRLALAIQILPYSSASIERTFSSTVDIKTVKRNKISQGALEACLLLRQETKQECLVITPAMLRLYEDSFKAADKEGGLNSNNKRESIIENRELKSKSADKPEDLVAPSIPIMTGSTGTYSLQHGDNYNDADLVHTIASNFASMLMNFKPKNNALTNSINIQPRGVINSNILEGMVIPETKKLKPDSSKDGKDSKVHVNLSDYKRKKNSSNSQ